MFKEYIGDGCYARLENGPTVVLTAENGFAIIAEVSIDYDDLPKLLMYIKVHFPETFSKIGL